MNQRVARSFQKRKLRYLRATGKNDDMIEYLRAPFADAVFRDVFEKCQQKIVDSQQTHPLNTSQGDPSLKKYLCLHNARHVLQPTSDFLEASID